MKIHDYVRKGNIKQVMRLINQGVDVNRVEKALNRTPLMIAAFSGDANVEMLGLLIQNGADVNAQRYKKLETPLYYAVTAGDIDKIRFLCLCWCRY